VTPGNTMTETEKLEDVQQIIGAVFDAGMCFGDQQDRSLSRSQYLDVRKAAVAAALTAWNTRPSVVEPVAWREAVAALTGLDDDEWEVLQAHCPEDLRRRAAGLFARPSVVPDREGVARIVLEAMNSTVWGSPGFTSGALWPPRAEKAADAILALLSASTVEG